MTTYLTAEQVSEKTGLGYTTVLEWAKKGLIPARIVPNGKKSKYFFTDIEIDKCLERFKNNPL